jgi:hypothetical protein
MDRTTFTRTSGTLGRVWTNTAANGAHTSSASSIRPDATVNQYCQASTARPGRTTPRSGAPDGGAPPRRTRWTTQRTATAGRKHMRWLGLARAEAVVAAARAATRRAGVPPDVHAAAHHPDSRSASGRRRSTVGLWYVFG